MRAIQVHVPAPQELTDDKTMRFRGTAYRHCIVNSLLDTFPCSFVINTM